MKTRSLILSTLFLSLPALAAPPVAVLGVTKLTFRPDVDVLTLRPCPTSANFPVRAVQLRVLRRAADVDFMAVQFGDGTSEQLQVRERFAAGSASRWIDLPGGARCIRKIAVVGDTEGLPFGPQAKIELLGAR